jgi:hypothetical protein
MYTFVDFTSQIWAKGGPLSHKQGGLIHQIWCVDTFVDFTSQIAGPRGVPCPTNKGVSYTNLMCWLDRDLKNRLLLLLL